MYEILLSDRVVAPNEIIGIIYPPIINVRQLLILLIDRIQSGSGYYYLYTDMDIRNARKMSANQLRICHYFYISIDVRFRIILLIFIFKNKASNYIL